MANTAPLLKLIKAPSALILLSSCSLLLHLYCLLAWLLLLALLAVEVHLRSSLLSISPSHQSVSELMYLNGVIARCCSPDLKITLWYDPYWIDCMLLRLRLYRLAGCCRFLIDWLRVVAAGLVCSHGGFWAFVGWISSQAVRCSEMNHVLMVILTSLMVYQTSWEDLWCS